MKSSSTPRRTRTLRARAATMDHDYDDYGPEPNMKLSHAFMVVLALHVIAVGGLFAFNKVKANHAKNTPAIASESLAAKETEPSETTPTAEAAPIENHATAKTAVNHSIISSKTTVVAPAKLIPAAQTVSPVTASATAPAVTSTTGGQLPSSPNATMPVATSTPTTETVAAPAAAPVEAVSSVEYTVVKGDNPYKIAKRFHVSYDELMKMNNITDARKIQIGQKLKIPATKKTKKKI